MKSLPNPPSDPSPWAGGHRLEPYGDFDYLIRNESGFFAPFSFNQRPDPIPLSFKGTLQRSGRYPESS